MYHNHNYVKVLFFALIFFLFSLPVSVFAKNPIVVPTLISFSTNHPDELREILSSTSTTPIQWNSSKYQMQQHIQEKAGFSKISSTFVTNEIELVEPTSLFYKPDLKSSKATVFSPQKVTVIKEENHFFLIETWLGNFWIHPNRYINQDGKKKQHLLKPYSLYHDKTIASKSSGKINPQLVTITEETSEWLGVETWVGTRYIYKNEGKKKEKNSSEKRAEKNKGTKVAYLTFDDGPNKYTKNILQILKKYNAKATFFMLEPNMRNNPEIVKQMQKEGHFTALHSVSHDKEKLYGGHPSNPAKEMEVARKTLQSITGENHYLVRVPYGSVPYMTTPFRDALAKQKFKMWDWSIDSNDWRYTSETYKGLVEEVKKTLATVEKNKEEVVILMHDRSQTVRALPEIITYLQSKGYNLVPYSPKNHKVMNFWDDERL